LSLVGLSNDHRLHRELCAINSGSKLKVHLLVKKILHVSVDVFISHGPLSRLNGSLTSQEEIKYSNLLANIAVVCEGQLPPCCVHNCTCSSPVYTANNDVTNITYKISHNL